MKNDSLMSYLKDKYSSQPEFLSAAEEILADVEYNIRDFDENSFKETSLRLVEPDRIIKFKVEWFDDEDKIQVNDGWRIQFNNSIGPYKGGLRFHPTVNESVLKFLAFEQTFKNALTDLPIGGAKGGSNFNPKGKSRGEIRRFCEAFMLEILPFIGTEVDIPAGDIGVGSREIGYLYGQYLKVSRTHSGILTGKGLDYGGSEIRQEATGYGCAYILKLALLDHDHDINGKSVLVSGAGNVALYCVEKLIELGAKPLTISDSGGTLFFKDGITKSDIEKLKIYKFDKRERLSNYQSDNAVFHPEKKPWFLKADIIVPCATQSEVSQDDIHTLLENGLIAVAEGANMPLTNGAIKTLENRTIFLPGKASNAGGVAVSMIEKSQNALFTTYTPKQVNKKLETIMDQILKNCKKNISREDGIYPYKKGANLYAFKKVLNAHEALMGKSIIS